MTRFRLKYVNEYRDRHGTPAVISDAPVAARSSTPVSPAQFNYGRIIIALAVASPAAAFP